MSINNSLNIASIIASIKKTADALGHGYGQHLEEAVTRVQPWSFQTIILAIKLAEEMYDVVHPNYPGNAATNWTVARTPWQTDGIQYVSGGGRVKVNIGDGNCAIQVAIQTSKGTAIAAEQGVWLQGNATNESFVYWEEILVDDFWVTRLAHLRGFVSPLVEAKINKALYPAEG